MAERNTNSGNLIVAVIIAIIVGVVVYFMIDNKPTSDTQTSTFTGTGALSEDGAVAPETVTGS